MQAKSREEITSDKSTGIETWVSRRGYLPGHNSSKILSSLNCENSLKRVAG